jgi:hypothetical protein
LKIKSPLACDGATYFRNKPWVTFSCSFRSEISLHYQAATGLLKRNVFDTRRVRRCKWAHRLITAIYFDQIWSSWGQSNYKNMNIINTYVCVGWLWDLGLQFLRTTIAFLFSIVYRCCLCLYIG